MALPTPSLLSDPTAQPSLSALVNRRLAMVPPGYGVLAAPPAGAPTPAADPGAPPDPGAAPAAPPPVNDVETALGNLPSPYPQGGGVQNAVSRALIGFSRGMAATPKEAYGGTALAGIEGGLAGTGEGIMQDRLLQYQYGGGALRRAVLQKMMETQAEAAAKEPYAQENLRFAHQLAGSGADAPTTMSDPESGQTFVLNPSRAGARWTPIQTGDAASRAAAHGISVEDELRLRKEAGKNAMAQGLDFDSPGYGAFIDKETARLAQQAKQMGVRGITPAPAPAQPSRPVPRTAADYLSGQ